MFSIISLLFWLLVIPFCIGLIPVRFLSPDRRNPGLVILAGYFCMWAVFGIVTIPAVLWVQYHNFSVASDCFTVLSILCAAAGLFVWYRNAKAGNPGLLTGRSREKSSMVWAERIEWLIFFGLAGFQLYKAAAYASFDGDDAYYVVASLIAQQADVMYRILPLTGGSTGLDVRHALAVFPMWVAFIAVKSDIHATIVSHVVMPIVLIPLTYLMYYEIGRILFRAETDGADREEKERAAGIGRKKTGDRKTAGNREKLPVFMILMCMFQIFGNVSIYTNETFFLTRTWQGKAVAGSLVIPAFLWLFLSLYDRIGKERRSEAGLWLLLACVNVTAGICSSIAIFIVSILTAVTAFCLMIVERDFKVLVKIGAACIPNLIYMGIYVIMAYSYLLG